MKGAVVDETVEQHFLPDWQLCYYPDPSQYVFFTPYMFANLYPDYQWKPEKPLTNNVLPSSRRSSSRDTRPRRISPPTTRLLFDSTTSF